MKIKDMTANDWNFNVMSKEDYEKMKKGIKENHNKGLPLWEGEKVIICEGSNHYIILDGEHKTKACRELGINEISDDLILNKGKIPKSQQMRITEIKNVRGSKDPIKYAEFLKKQLEVEKTSQIEFAKKRNMSKSQLSRILKRTTLSKNLKEKVVDTQLSGHILDEVLNTSKENWKDLIPWASKEKPSFREIRKKAKALRGDKSDRPWNTDYIYKLLSALQKDIRRGKEKEEQALFWATELEEYDYSMLWNRLEVIASEDVGVVNPILPVIIGTLRHQYEDAVRRRNPSYRLFLSNAILVLCRSPKMKMESKQINVDLNKIVGRTRVADDLLWKVYGEKHFEGKKLEIPEYALDSHTGNKKEGTEKWIKEGTKLVNEVKLQEDNSLVNPYTEEANRIRLKYNDLPKVFPRRTTKVGSWMKERAWKEPFDYEDTQSWNPFVGCDFNCSYCYLQDVLPWQGRTQHCELCKTLKPHEHPERLNRIKNAKVLFVSSLGELAFCKHEFMLKIIDAMKRNNRKERIWILQSKAPKMFQKYVNILPENVFLDTTIETNRDISNISKAPMPKTRFEDFLNLKWKNKGVSVEPIIDFDLEPFADMLIKINPKVVFLGFNSTPKKTPIPEPSWNKTLKLMGMLDNVGIPVLPKLLPKTAYKDFWDLPNQKVVIA